MARLLAYLFSAGGFACVSLACVIWLAVRPRAAAPRRWLVGVVVFYAFASIRVVPWVLSRPLLFGLESTVSADAESRSTAIVLLGSGSHTAHGFHQRLGLLDPAGASRVLEAARLYHQLGSPWIISSGGVAPGFEIETSGATMRHTLLQLGVPDDRILLETTSQTTRDEAVLVGPMLRALHADRVILVTSETHMRRSLGAFRASGIDAVPAMAKDPLQYQSRWKSIVPTREGLEFSGATAHEYVGLVYYFARGWLR